MRGHNISERPDRARCYGITITADGMLSDGMTFHNALSAVLRIFMAIVRHYSRYPVRWRLQAERGNNTHRLHYQAFVDFGCDVKMRTVLHWMPEGTHLEPVRDTPEDVRRAADYCIKDATRCADDDEDLDLMAGPYSFGFGDAFDANNKLRALDVCDDAAPHARARTRAGEYYTSDTSGMDASGDDAPHARARTRAGEYYTSDTSGMDASGDDAIGFGTDYDELFDDDVSSPASGEPAAIASSPASGMDAIMDASGDDAIGTEPEPSGSAAIAIGHPSIGHASIAGTSSTEADGVGMHDPDYYMTDAEFDALFT